MFKKVFLNILLFLMTFMLFTLAGCGEYKGISNSGEGGGGNTTTSSGVTSEEGETSDSGSGQVSERVFSVSLVFNGKPFTKAKDAGVEAQWTRTDGIQEVHRAAFDENGYASVKGLDGNYQVSLEVPKGNEKKFNYVYNTNNTKTTNGNRDIEITIYRLGNLASGSGKNAWDPYEISAVGVYEAEIKSAESKVYFVYAPKKSGTYTIESWADVKTDKINPKMEMFDSYVLRSSYFTVNDGGASGTFTKNFSYEVDMDESNFAADGNGQVLFVFAICAEEIDASYPIKVRFAIHYKAPFSYDVYPNELIAATELNMMILDEIVELREMPEATFLSVTGLTSNDYASLQSLTEGQLKDVHTPYRYFRNSKILTYILNQYTPTGTQTYPEVTNKKGVTYFDGSMFKYYDPEKYPNGDGFFHVYDAVKYSSTDGFGPILYAQITMSNRFFAPYTAPGSSSSTPISLNNIEMPGNKNLSVAVKDEDGNIMLRNHKVFIEGYNALKGSYFCGGACRCQHFDAMVCLQDCAECSDDCRNCPEALVETLGYADVSVGAGVFPVTMEMKIFLQQFAVSQRYFMDGNGWAETSIQPTIDCAEDDQWLFGCLYYV